jgi:hypothetical protein
LEFVLSSDVALTPASTLYNRPDLVPNVEIESKVSDNDTEEPEKEADVVDIEELALSDPVAYEKFLEQRED